MSKLFTYRKRVVISQDIDFLTKLIADNPQKNRYALSKMVCRQWGWTQPNGILKDGVCRGLMLKLHREGHIKLPARKRPFPGGRQSKQLIRRPDMDETPICSTVKKLQPITISQVQRTKYEKLFNGLIEHPHYLGYTQPVGEHLKYIISSGERLLPASLLHLLSTKLSIEIALLAGLQKCLRKIVTFLPIIPDF